MISSIQRSWHLLDIRQRLVLTSLSFLRIIVNLLDIIGIALVGIVVSLAANGSFAFRILNFDFGLSDSQISITLLFTALAFLMKGILSMFFSRLTFLYLARIESILSVRIARQLFCGTLMSLRRMSASEIDWAILRSTQKAITGILGTAVAFAAELSLALLVFLFILFTDWRLALTVTVYFSVILALFHFVSRNRFKVLGKDFTEGSIEVSIGIADLVSTFREISILEKTEFFIDRISVPREKVAKAQAVHDFLGSVPRLIVEIGLIIGAIGYFAFAFSLDSSGGDFSKLAVFLVASLKVMAALLPIQRAFQLIKYDGPLASAAHDFFSANSSEQRDTELPGVTARPRKTTDVSDRGAELSLRAVSFSFEDDAPGRNIVEGLTLSASPGSFVAVVGQSGSGKSTLAELSLGLYPPKSGSILIDGMNPRLFRKIYPGSIGFVPQKPGLLSGSVMENVAVGVPRHLINEDSLEWALEMSHLAETVRMLPRGVDSILGDGSGGLSGGEVQRLGLARALYSRPRLLVLDESTSALDAETEDLIAASLEKIRGGTTFLVVAHRLSTIQKANEIHLMDQGKIVASGTFDELKQNSPIMKRYADLMHLDRGPER